MSNIGPEPSGNLVLDGGGYGLRIRLGLLVGRIGVSQGHERLYDAARTITTLVRECSMVIQAVPGVREF